MADFKDVFGKGGAVGEQLLVWGVLQQLLGALLAPALEEVTRAVNLASQTTPLSPADLADMVVRNIVALADGIDYAKQSGVAPSDFQRMVHNAGDAPAPQELVTALRRKVIPESGRGPSSLSFEQGIAEGRLLDKWTGVIKALGVVPLPVADAVDAVVEGQISFDEGQAAAFKNGVEAADFQILVNTRGNPPSPTELNLLHKRGLIPLEGTGPDVTSVQQGVFEGATKDKWWRLLAALSDYVPPPRTVTAMVRSGAMTDDEALKWYQYSGLTPDLAAAYLSDAHHQKTATSRDLAKGDVLALYGERVISADQATQMLALLGYSAEDAAFEEQLVDFRVVRAQVDGAIAKIKALYVARKIDQAAAVGALDALGLQPTQRDQLVSIWDIERQQNVKVLTQAEIAAAFHYQIIDQTTAIGELVNIGYTPYDAWVILSIREHSPQPNQPAQGPAA